MNLQKIYTALLTADLAGAEGWYTKLLGRGPDYRPMDTLLHWELFDQGGLMLSSSEEIAEAPGPQHGMEHFPAYRRAVARDHFDGQRRGLERAIRRFSVNSSFRSLPLRIGTPFSTKQKALSSLPGSIARILMRLVV
jgi:hypothetical protein